MRLGIIVVSTRPTRKGPAVAAWFEGQARAHGGFEIDVLDLAEIDLPLFDEPEHPRLRKYRHDHTKAWSARIDRADAFVFVTPEYNFSSPPSLVNAIDYLMQEWAYKPVGFVSYGGTSGGLRGVEMTKQMMTALKMVPLPEAVSVPMFTDYLEDGVFKGTERHERAAAAMLHELGRWARALQVLRQP